MKKVPIIIITLSIAACASNPDKISTAYISPLTYAKYDCQQIALEMTHVQRRTTELYGSLKKERKKDNWMMGIGMVLFWPTLFALSGGDGPEAAEFSRLKGENEALRQVSVEKKCLNTSMMSFEDIIKAADKMKLQPENTPEPAAQVASGAVEQNDPQIRSVDAANKNDCEFIKTITKGAGGSGDTSKNLEHAMKAALNQAANAGADSYFIVNTNTTVNGASVVLEALSCE